MKKALLLPIVLWLLACSKDNATDEGANAATLSLPSSLVLTLSSEEEVNYQLSYNQQNQIQTLSIIRSSDGDLNQFQANFSYAANGILSEVSGTSDEEPFQMTFSFDENDVISDMEYVSGNEEINFDISYDEIQNNYLVNFVEFDLPLSFDFDTQNRLSVLGVQDNDLIPNYSDFEKGIFHDVNLQPALHIWNGVFFFLAPWELYFLSERDIQSFNRENPANPTVQSRYQNKLRDGMGNLLAFQLSIGNFGTATINYTISYENRTL